MWFHFFPLLFSTPNLGNVTMELELIYLAEENFLSLVVLISVNFKENINYSFFWRRGLY